MYIIRSKKENPKLVQIEADVNIEIAHKSSLSGSTGVTSCTWKIKGKNAQRTQYKYPFSQPQP